ncbi:MAG: hypothetical protein HIU82_20845 [Proteobacteria bacterium]|nr:hypothetical protein [Pseudomonadota bacterium]
MRDPTSDSEVPGTTVLAPEDWIRLRELARGPPDLWWRNYPLMISVAAFALSLITSVVSAYIGYRRGVHDQQEQLAAAIGTIQKLDLERTNILQSNRGKTLPVEVIFLMNAEINSALKDARDLALRLGSDANTAELVTVAQGLVGLDDLQNARRLLTTGLEVAQNPDDLSVALRNLGYLDARFLPPARGLPRANARYRQAIAIDKVYDLRQSPYLAGYLKAIAAFEWAAAIAPLDCADAQRHFASGIVYQRGMPPSQDMDYVRRMAIAQETSGLGGIAACQPTSTSGLTPPTRPAGAAGRPFSPAILAPAAPSRAGTPG